MRSSRPRIARIGLLLLLVFMVPAGSSRSHGLASCDAEVEGSYGAEETYDDYKDKVFSVEISSPAECAKVYFDLLTTERLFNGEEIKTTTTTWRKVTAGGEPFFKLKFRMAIDSDLIDWEIRFRSCTICGS